MRKEPFWCNVTLWRTKRPLNGLSICSHIHLSKKLELPRALSLSCVHALSTCMCYKNLCALDFVLRHGRELIIEFEMAKFLYRKLEIRLRREWNVSLDSVICLKFLVLANMHSARRLVIQNLDNLKNKLSKNACVSLIHSR